MTMENVKVILKEMKLKGVSHIFPNRDLQNPDIKELIIDEEGNVFILPVVGEEVMLPQFVEAVEY
jgi:hypothetical protein